MVTAGARSFRRDAEPLRSGQPALLPKQRQQILLELVRTSGGVRISDATARFNVSEMTIRRDLHALVRTGLLDRVHGGAASSGRGTALNVDQHDSGSEPSTAGAWLFRFVEPGSCVALSAGNATLSAVGQLGAIRDLTIVTNSTRALAALSDLPGRRTVVLIGGERMPWDALVGPLAEQCIATMHFDTLVLAAFGISASGLTTPDLAESQTNRQFIRSAQRVVLLAGANTWGRRSLAHFASLDDIDVFLTDSTPTTEPWINAELSDRIVRCDDTGER